MTLRDLPPVRALAEERAKRLHATERAIIIEEANGRSAAPPWDDAFGTNRAFWIRAQIDILCNLRDNADSRDAVARLVAAKVGADLSGGIVYTLTQRTEGGRKIKTWVVCDCNGDDFPVLADTKIMDPIEALQVMALAVLA
jgi:hypothetical protein